MVGAFVSKIPPAMVRTVFTRHVVGTCEHIGDWTSRQEPQRRMIACHLEPLYSLRKLIDSTLNQLAMLLFSSIKKNPNPPGRYLRGLLVIDEARDFVPSQKASVCKDSLMQLTAQARKYHLGLVFATQNPKDIDAKIVGNCSTHVYGKANAPAAIDVIREQIRLKGGTGDDIPRLKAGQFYVHNADLDAKAPTKIVAPMCLSQHPRNPLDESEILQRAAANRKN